MEHPKEISDEVHRLAWKKILGKIQPTENFEFLVQLIASSSFDWIMLADILLAVGGN